MTSRGNGGGVRLYSCAAAAVRGNRIEGNTALTGGGIAIASCTSTQVTGNRIIGNRAFSGWSARPMCGGIYSTGQELIAGNLVAANTMGGIVCTGAAAIRNNTVVGNNTDSQFASLECTSGAAQVVNNIVAFNTWGVWSTASMFRNNCVFGNTEADVVYSGGADIMAANGNISADPMLADTAYGNLHIQPGSPCIDAGDDSAVGADETDIDGQSRIQGSHVDIGADESDGTEWPSGQYSVVRVTPTGSDSNDGSGWDNARAMKTVQSALDAAALKGGEVWVKAGVYPELVSIPAYAYLYGGFAGTETDKAQRDWHKNETVLDGQQKGTVVIIPGGYNVTCVDGFTVRNGKSLAHYHDAGGIECSGCSTIAHNTVADNVGTGIVTSYSYSATVSDNTIRGNTEGAVACGSIHPVLTGNAIVGNTFTSDYSNSACVLVGPSPGSGFYGGPDNASAVPYGIVTNNVIAGNTAYNSVVWLNNVEAFANNTIVANTVATTGYPRALYAWGDNFGRAENNVIAFNTGSVGQLRYSGTGSAFAVYRNNNVFGNTPGNYDVTFHTDPTGMDGNISVDPLFVDMVGGDYQLRWDSPCVDAGTNEGAPLWDILGNPRPVDGNLDRTAVTDMGAFEYAPVKVAVDIMPEDASNQIAPQKKGMVTVAILGTADFAVSSINPTTVVFGPGNATEVHGRGHMEDVNLDGRVDMLFHFRCEDIGLTTGTSAVCISGRLLTGEPFIGSDTVNATSASPAKHR